VLDSLLDAQPTVFKHRRHSLLQKNEKTVCSRNLAEFGDQEGLSVVVSCKVKGKVFPYSLPSVGPGADPGVQAVSPQVT